MRIFFTVVLGLLSMTMSIAQDFNPSFSGSGIIDPIDWKASVEKQNDSVYHLVFKASLDQGWHLYSQQEVEGGPLNTEFSFNDSPQTYELLGETQEPFVETQYDPVFQMDVKFFKDEVTFVQPIKILSEDITQVESEVYFNVCDDQQCLAPETVPFTLSLETGTTIVSTVQVEVSERDRELTQALKLDIKGGASLGMDQQEDTSYFNLFLLGFLGGLIALLTPCVFPMIPLTVSFFTKGATDKKKGLFNAVMYGFFIFLIYLLLSLPFHLLDSISPEFLNNISTNVALNVIFFIIFIAFAFSFFGYYEINLPSSWSSKMDRKASNVGGLIGIFFMALTLAIVSFSCTGPILGSLLGGSLTGDGGAMQLSFGMAGFGLALALPFALFALFPNWLNSLPKSGGWLNSVKVVLGFIELGFAFKFLSNADLVEHWGILKREIFIGIWILIGIGLTLYLFGLIRFPHDGPKTKPGRWRVTLGVFSLAFVIYLIPGLTNTPHANLKLLSGFPPPLFYSVYEKETEGPLGLIAYNDFDEGVAAARAAQKPILLDFTGWACVNCRKMEEQVWSDPAVFQILQEEYILISLYVDDRKELPQEQQFDFLRSDGGLKKIRTIGDKWATFQTLNFRNNSQPFYVLLDADINLLNEPVGYTPNESRYLDWLQSGVDNFKQP